MNKVTNWTSDIPTAPGLYLVCYGDVETLDNIKAVRFLGVAGDLYTNDGLRPCDWGDSYKWARLVVGSGAKA